MLYRENALVDFLLFVLFVVAGLFLAQFLATLSLLPLHGYDMGVLTNKMSHPLEFPEMKMQLLFLQGIGMFCSFIVAPLVFIRWKEKNVTQFLYYQTPSYYYLLFPFLIVVISMPFTSLIVEWNESVRLPSYLAGIEKWAREKEDYSKEITTMLTSLNNPTELFWGLLVVALIPALGEELVFRGYLQTKFMKWTGSSHLAIWVSAILFSAIHFQFYGFVPRMVLGAIFGYIYYFSGQFHFPVIAHFTNNCFMLVLIYLKSKNHISFNIESEEQIPLPLALASLLATIGLFYVFIHVHKKRTFLTTTSRD